MNFSDKTSAVFFTHEGVRTYRTGDIVRLVRDDDGFNVDYIGRGDRQVKIRGLRIELDEVEAVIHDFPGVSDAAVVAFDGEIRQHRPEEFAFDVEELRFKNLDELKKNLLRPYDLLNDRLIRAAIARTDDGKIYVYFDMNYSVFDGKSQQIFMRDIERAYNGESLEPEKFSGWEAALLEERLLNSPQYQKAKDLLHRAIQRVLA